MKKVAFIKKSNGSHWVGNGFPVRNIFSYNDIAEELSPFLLMDYAGPTQFEATSERRGVGAHPHRGFETVTIVYQGGVSHRDSSGGGGTIGPGDVQWMTAGSGVLHEEFHSDEYAQHGGPFEMIQLWVNLPARDKMTSPTYQGISNDQIPSVSLAENTGSIRVIAGQYEKAKGPAHTFSPMNVWDVKLNAGHSLLVDLENGHTCALFVLRGAIHIGDQTIREAEMAVMERSDSTLAIEAATDVVLLLLSGEPLNEPIVGQGPFVMNTREEINQAILDFNHGLFDKISVSE